MRDKDTSRDFALFFLRVVVGLLMFYYGAQKFMGWFGGMGFQPTINIFQEKMGIPVPFAVLAIVAEFFGGLGLLVGGLTRIAAFGVAVTMAVATYTNFTKMTTWVPTETLQNPVASVGFPAALLAISVALMCLGGGNWSLDRFVMARRRK